MIPQPKEHRIYCEEYLEFVRGLPCYFCPAMAPSQPHHWPPKGRGIVDDTRTVPCCHVCHRRAHGERIATAIGIKPPLTGAEVEAAVDATLRRFIREAPRPLLDAYADVMTDWRAARGL